MFRYDEPASFLVRRDDGREFNRIDGRRDFENREYLHRRVRRLPNWLTYSKVEEFFTLYCEIMVEPADLDGTSRQRFINITQHATPSDQAKILRGLLEKVPEPTAEGPRVMTVEDVRKLISRLGGLPVPAVRPANSREAVERALADAETLMREQGPVSAVDRIHTALHGHCRTRVTSTFESLIMSGR